jgi:hypothetical protein
MLSKLLRLIIALAGGATFFTFWAVLSFQGIEGMTSPDATAAIRSSADIRGALIFTLVWGFVGGATLVGSVIASWHFPLPFDTSKQGS